MASYKALKPVVVAGKPVKVGSTFEGPQESMKALLAEGYAIRVKAPAKKAAKTRANKR